jgi:hypothetical protein
MPEEFSASSNPLDRREFLQAASVLSAAATTGRTAVLPREQADQPKPIYLTDMARCEPHSALSQKARRNHWMLLDYQTDEHKGVMLVAGHNSAAPEVRYPLVQKGWHAVSIGLHSWYEGEYATRLEVKLNSDSTFSEMIHHATRDSRNHIEEYFWKIADVTDQSIVFRQLIRQVVPDDPNSVGNPCSPAWIAYIKLVPLTDEEVQALKRDRDRRNHRRLFAHNDAWSYTYTYRPTSAADIRRELEPFRDTDFARIYWEAGAGDRMNYPSKIGFMCTDDWIADPYRIGDRLAAETWQTFRKKGIDPFRVACDYAHQIGLELHASYRTTGFHFPVPYHEWNAGGLYEKHPEWRCTDRQGQSTPRLSYAYPDVRRFIVSLLKETASYPIDGICMLYNRRPPVVEYEAPIVKGFKAKYGLDPRQLDHKDPRWLKYRATFVTQFMREVREAMQQVSRDQKRSKPLEVSAIVMNSEAENLYFGMDVEAWVKEKLVDTIIPYSSALRLDSSQDSWLDPKDADFFLHITEGTGCKLALNLMPRQISGEEYRKRAARLYRAGVEHLFFWDTNARNRYGLSWDALRRLGHQPELEAWIRNGSPKLEVPRIRLRKLGDWDLSYDTPG